MDGTREGEAETSPRPTGSSDDLARPRAAPPDTAIAATVRRSPGEPPHEAPSPDPDAIRSAPPSGAASPGASPADATRIAAGAPAEDSPTGLPAPATPAQRIGRYELRGLLGRGAMGTVYRAFDTQLKRDVALKLLRLRPGDAAEQFQRFRHEAEAAARLRHPNLVAVHDLGTEGGDPFLTMELIEGGSLAQYLADRGGRLPPHEAMRLARDVALGLACAHEHGIVHRDLKPENILLDRASDGAAGGSATGCPKISDFGLAHTIGAPGDARLTLRGAVLGTPTYMAPEQAAGLPEEVDARSDVYALGSVLYEAAGGRPAYPGTDPMAVLLAKLAHDPPPPRGLGRDLETIILKAMAREPGRRYASARELAEDLDRCLAGAAILARPESGFDAALRRVRRHRGVTAAAMLAVVSLALAGGSTWSARVERREQVRLEAEALRHLRSVAETSLDASLALRRAGLPVAAQEPFLERVEKTAKEAAARGPASAEPHYRLGRLYRALLRFDAARAEQERALAKEPGHALARYERALLDLRRWEQRLAELRAAWVRDEGRRLAESGLLARAGLGGTKLPDPPADVALAAGDAEAASLRDRIQGDLARLEQGLPGGAEAACLRGLVQLHGATEAELAEGAERVERALAADPSLEEGYEGLARSAHARGKFAEAARQYGRGIAVDAGYVPFHLGRAAVAAAEAERTMSFGGDPIPACERATADLTRALELDPDLPDARLRRGRVLALWADRLGENGADPEPTFARALADLTAAVDAEPDRAEAWLARGSLQGTWGYWMSDRALDPSERYAFAVADYGRAIERAPHAAAGWGGRGDVRRHWGLYTKNRGADPRAHYAEALADYAEALARDPRSAELWKSRAVVRQALATFARLRGEPWREGLAEARADLDRALELEPRSVWILGLRAQGDVLWGGCLTQDGEEPAEAFGRAIADFDALLREQPAPFPRIERASCRIQWAEHEHGRGRDAESLIVPARADLEAARADASGSFGFGLVLGRLELLEAHRAHARGGDPLPFVARAQTALAQSIERNPAATEAHMRLGMVGRHEGAWRAGRGEDPEPAWTVAEADFGKALAINPRWEQVWLGRGLLRLERAVFRAARGEDAGAAFTAALADLGQVVEVNPNYVDGWRALGEAKRRWSEHGVARGSAEARLRLEEARADLDRALARGPNHAAARLERGRVRLALGDRKGAAEDLEWVAERVPAWQRECAEMLEKARGD